MSARTLPRLIQSGCEDWDYWCRFLNFRGRCRMYRWGTSILMFPTKSHIPSTLSGSTALVGSWKIFLQSKKYWTPKSWVFLICRSIFCLQPWRSAPSRTAWWGRTSTQRWNRACSTCWTGSVSSTQVRQVTRKITLLWHVTPSFHFSFCPAGNIFEGEYVDVFTMVKHIDYPRDRENGNIVAAVHPRLQVRPQFIHSLF